MFMRIVPIMVAITLTGCGGGSSGSAEPAPATKAGSPPTEAAVPTARRYIDRVFSEVSIERDLIFAANVVTETGVANLALDVFTPEGDTVRDRPVMIVAYGGGFIEGTRAEVADVAADFARRGYVAATFDYRVLGGAPATAGALLEAGLRATQDLFAAVRFFRSDALNADRFGTRADAIFVTGFSAGAVIAIGAATLDADDTFTSAEATAYFAGNGGVFGTTGENPNTDSSIQGALSLSGATFDLGTIDSASALLFAAHEGLDPVVPCGTAPEGSSNTGLVVSGSCDVVPAYTAAGAEAELFVLPGSAGHVEFSSDELEMIFTRALTLFRDRVIASSS